MRETRILKKVLFLIKYFLISLFIVLVTIAILFSMGRLPFCECGVISVWSSDVTSNQQSQQFFDPYSFTHFEHGILFYFLLWALFKKRLSSIQRMMIALGLESGWEVLENTNYILDRYRAVTVSFGYYGDSILNSVGDVFSMLLGFLVAWKMPKWATIAAMILIELLLLYFIRDNLIINIIMLIYPIEAIKVWQGSVG